MKTERPMLPDVLAFSLGELPEQHWEWLATWVNRDPEVAAMVQDVLEWRNLEQDSPERKAAAWEKFKRRAKMS